MKLFALLKLSTVGLGIIAANPAVSNPLSEAQASITIAAHPDIVWGKIRVFGDFSWHPAVVSTQLTINEAGGTRPVRTLVLDNGAKIMEQLQENSDATRVQRYTIVESPLPVSDYDAVIRVQPSGNGGSLVIWEARFRVIENTDTNAGTVTSLMNGIFSSGLTNLKEVMEKMR